MSLHWTGPKAWEDDSYATILRERWQNERDEPAYADPDADAEYDEDETATPKPGIFDRLLSETKEQRQQSLTKTMLERGIVTHEEAYPIDPRRCECRPYGSELCLDCQVAEWDARHD